MTNRLALTTLALALATPAVAFAQPPGTDPLAYPGPAWSPYLVGALIGLLSMATFYFSDKPLGASTAYARLAGMVGKLFARRHTESLKYYQDFKPKVDWEVMLVVGAVGGAFLAAWLGGELTGEWLPAMWTARFGEDSLALAAGGRVRRRGLDGVRCADGRRVYQRPRDQRHDATVGRVVDRGRVLLRRRDRHRVPDVPGVADALTGRRTMTMKNDVTARPRRIGNSRTTNRQGRAGQRPPGGRLTGKQLALGLLFGLAFGFLLQKGGVAKYHVLIGVLLLEDFTVIKVMLSAIVVGMIGVFALYALGLVKLHIKPTRYAANILGGLMFGVGFALLSYCPGTGAAALGQGNFDALAGVLGLMAGSYLYAESSGCLGRTVLKWGDRGKLMLPGVWVSRRRSSSSSPVLVGVLVVLDRTAAR